ncbi:MAG: hypothetical protein Q8P67_05505, partial [archaeon]|nr:hypothetical protein [archaeon]
MTSTSTGPSQEMRRSWTGSQLGPMGLSKSPSGLVTNIWVSTHAHLLEFSVAKASVCDGRLSPDGCLSGITSHSRSSEEVLLYRCAKCDYKECGPCARSHRIDDPMQPRLAALGFSDGSDKDPLLLQNLSTAAGRSGSDSQPSFMERIMIEFLSFALDASADDSMLAVMPSGALSEEVFSPLQEAFVAYLAASKDSGPSPHFQASLPSPHFHHSSILKAHYASTISRLLQSLHTIAASTDRSLAEPLNSSSDAFPSSSAPSSSTSSSPARPALTTSRNGASHHLATGKITPLDPVLCCIQAGFEMGIMLLEQSLKSNPDSAAALVSLLGSFSSQLRPFSLSASFEHDDQKRRLFFSCILRLSSLLEGLEMTPELLAVLFPLYLSTGYLPHFVFLINAMLRASPVPLDVRRYTELSALATQATRLCFLQAPTSAERSSSAQAPLNTWDPAVEYDEVHIETYSRVSFDAGSPPHLRRALARYSWPPCPFPGSSLDLYYFEITVTSL